MNLLSPPIYLRQIQIPILPLPRHVSLSSLVTTEIAPNSEETPVVQILNPHNSENDVQLVEPVTETPIQHARKRALSGQQIQAGKLMRTTKRKLSELSVGTM
jgi:hypothetical protein